MFAPEGRLDRVTGFPWGSMFTDFFTIFYWWLVIFLLGVIFLPLTLSLFKKFWDRGWIFSKIIAIISTSYLVFLLGALRVLPFYKETILLVLLTATGLSAWLLLKNKGKGKEVFIKEIRSKWKIFLFEEIIFFIALFFWSLIRGFQPDIEGLEKFMDFGFVNSILRSKWFPPADMWFAGESINYYYFGHLQAAVLTRLSGLKSLISYNLMMATLFAFTFGGAFSLTSNLVFSSKDLKLKLKSVIFAGLLSALLISLGGNLHSAIYSIKQGKNNYWYPDATRFIGHNPDNPKDKTIHEFPIYSFVVSDLHGHVNNIPTVLLFLAVLLVYGLKLLDSKEEKREFFEVRGELSVMAFLLGVTYMTNSWDFPIYGTIFALTTFIISVRKLAENKKKVSLLVGWLKVFQKVFVKGIAVLFVSLLVALPFALAFKPMADGVAPVEARSLFWQLLILWGFFWFIGLGLIIFVIVQLIKGGKKLTVADLILFVSLLWATVLIVIPEIIYVKDIYISEYHRANTMFKLVYQSFMIYSIAAGYIFLRIKSYLLEKSVFLWILYFLIFLTGFLAQMVYPYFAIKGYYGNLKTYRGLDESLGFLERAHPTNLEALNWIEKNITGQPVMLEAVGDSYTLYNQISAISGLPTIEGWLVHEWLWRGGYDLPGSRVTEVEAIYQGDDDSLAERLLRDYGVEYLFFGPLEKEKYPDFKRERFNSLGKVVFSSGETEIYRLDRLER